MFTIIRKELAYYFTSYMVYIAAISFVLICNLFLWFFNNEFNLFNTGNASLSSFFFIAPWALLFLIPALTMRSFAGEEQNGTLEWLFTQPIKIQQIVTGKYISIFIVVLFFLLLTGFNIYIIQQLKQESVPLEFGVILSGYSGLFWVGICFVAIGIFSSTLTSNPVIAYVLSVFICFLMYYGFDGSSSYNLLGSLDYYVQNIGFKFHYQRFLKGVIYLNSIIYYVCIIVLFLLLSWLNVKNKK